MAYHPIIYVRGFAATESEIEETVSDPYMGFNIGSTKSRMAWTGDLKRFYFESPLIRLMSDHGYEDVFTEGDDLLQAEQNQKPIPYRSVIIYRYYDEASKDFGDGKTPPITHFAEGLGELILRLRDKVCANPDNHVTPDTFRVHLVAHSMGGLICRAFLQNEKLGTSAARNAVDKLFTYATPHNGIDMRVVRNVPGWLTFGDVNNFNRERMADYLGLDTHDDVSVVTNFPVDRIFNLIGTNPHDYTAAKGLSAWAVGDGSDGLVRIENATTHGLDADGQDVPSPRAYVNRSHSGFYGIVNSEEGFQNLTRFFFGAMRADGYLDVDEITLPDEVQKELANGKNVDASYQFEVVASVRGAQWQITRREAREQSAIFRKYDDLFVGKPGKDRVPNRKNSPHLFSIFLDPMKIVPPLRSMSFSFDVKVLVPDYVVDGVLFLKRHYEGGFIYRSQIIVEAFEDEHALGGWRIMYGFQEENPGRATQKADTRPIDEKNPEKGLTFSIPIVQATNPGLRGNLRVEAKSWD